MRLHFSRLLPFVVALFCGSLTAFSQTRHIEGLGAGKLLVAPRDPPDPRFAETVILLVQYDADGAVGLMINRQTRVAISEALDQSKAASRRSEPIYMGGPVELSGVLALVRSSSAPEDATPIFADVYAISTRSLLDKTLASSADSTRFRVYLGYCGWGAGQLDYEVKKGGWHVLDGDASLVFDADPASVWERLIARTERQMAGVPGLGRAGWNQALRREASSYFGSSILTR
jgi:putative transcriptional regulator